MSDLSYIASRLVETEKPANEVSLCFSAGLWFVRIEWADRIQNCTKASTAREALEIAADDLFDPGANRRYNR